MKQLNDNELKSIIGGAGATAAAIWKIVGIIAGVIFGIGVIDGYVRPLKCR